MKRKYASERASKKSKVSQLDLATKRAIKQMLFRNIELKRYYLVDYTSTGSNTGWVLPWPAQGVGVTQRIGDKINVDSFLMNCSLHNLGATDNVYRVVVHMSRSASLLGSADLFNGGSGNYITATVNTNYTNVLSDDIVDLSLSGATTKTLRRKIPLNNQVVTFDEGTSVPETRYIQVYVASASNTGIPGSGSQRFTGNFEIRYRDA